MKDNKILIVVIVILIGIWVTLSNTKNEPDINVNVSNYELVQINEGVIGILDVDINSNNYGEIVIYQLNESENKLNVISRQKILGQ